MNKTLQRHPCSIHCPPQLFILSPTIAVNLHIIRKTFRAPFRPDRTRFPSGQYIFISLPGPGPLLCASASKYFQFAYNFVFALGRISNHIETEVSHFVSLYQQIRAENELFAPSHSQRNSSQPTLSGRKQSHIITNSIIIIILTPAGVSDKDICQF